MDAIVNKDRKILSQNKWYHGTVFSNWESFCKNGVIADYNKDTSDSLDFGYGFYLAPTKERAESYIARMLQTSGVYSEDEKPMILEFEFTPIEWFDGEEYNTKIFSQYSDEFAIFVFENRTENTEGIKQHDYDVIYGVMSDSVPTKVIMEYKLGQKSKEEVLESLKKSTSMKQISLHNQKLCDIIKLTKAYVIDPDTNEKKELNINEYCK